MTKEQIIAINNTKVILSEENGITKVNILSDDAVISRNGEVLWGIGNEKEEFKHIPPIFHPFFLKYNVDYFTKTDDVSEIDITIDGLVFTFYIPKNLHDSIIVRYDFIDELAAKEYILDRFDEEEANKMISELQNKITEFSQAINTTGWNYRYSHSTGDWSYGWADASFPMEKWNENIMADVANLVLEFDKYSKELHEKLF